LPGRLPRLGIALIGAITLVLRSYAQTSPQAFEAATIKHSNPNKPQAATIRSSQGRFEANSTTLKELIAIAYDLNFDISQQISGGPGWVNSDKFDVVARADEAALARLRTIPAEQQGEQRRIMIEELLSDRFGLRIHREPKELTVYTLSIANKGPRLKPGQLQANLPANVPQTRINVMGPGFLEGHNAYVWQLAKTLSVQPEVAGRTVVDKTALTDKYDFTLKWMPESPVDRQSTQVDLPSLFTALQDQLGLRLTSAKATVEVVIIDSAKPPSEN
jgi:uncharacterized protein (TIGR03435 family)